VQEVLGYRAHRGMLGCIEQQSPIEKLGMLAQQASSSNRVALGPDPFAVAVETDRYFERRGVAMPSDVASELSQLAQTNTARAGAAREDDREVLEVVARAQSRHLLNHLSAGGFDDLVAALHNEPAHAS
jgi:hypothetical protein